MVNIRHIFHCLSIWTTWHAMGNHISCASCFSKICISDSVEILGQNIAKAQLQTGSTSTRSQWTVFQGLRPFVKTIGDFQNWRPPGSVWLLHPSEPWQLQTWKHKPHWHFSWKSWYQNHGAADFERPSFNTNDPGTDPHYDTLHCGKRLQTVKTAPKKDVQSVTGRCAALPGISGLKSNAFRLEPQLCTVRSYIFTTLQWRCYVFCINLLHVYVALPKNCYLGSSFFQLSPTEFEAKVEKGRTPGGCIQTCLSVSVGT